MKRTCLCDALLFVGGAPSDATGELSPRVCVCYVLGCPSPSLDPWGVVPYKDRCYLCEAFT